VGPRELTRLHHGKNKNPPQNTGRVLWIFNICYQIPSIYFVLCEIKNLAPCKTKPIIRNGKKYRFIVDAFYAQLIANYLIRRCIRRNNPWIINHKSAVKNPLCDFRRYPSWINNRNFSTFFPFNFTPRTPTKERDDTQQDDILHHVLLSVRMVGKSKNNPI